MKVFTKIKDIQEFLSEQKRNGKTIGFVPTMGYLHEGHLSLVKKATAENDLTVMSIFVNPIQFGPNEDFERYPRDFDRDRKLAEDNGVDVLFHPSVEEMYPEESIVQMNVKKRKDVLCGRTRKGHFDGVVTVLTKLFHITMPDRAYFGLKDAQQFAIVQGFVADLNFPIDIIGVETVREEDGLAKSSRNTYLSAQERKEAPEIYQALLKGKKAVENGVDDPAEIVRLVSDHIRQNTGGEIDYVEVLSFPELDPLERIKGKVIIATAVQFASARLIDNVILDLSR
ncbi:MULTISPECIES: pantoate--beta-alanine ligase [Bacillus]|mgnify:FL=1|uniref:Pantothenate synthetase n=1 Tax=Bacillus smithii 7_3_47FAA TaxID=665952 RepID=G9QP37_9BACI|nr:pantoate--beta-alanine ligase [Bacillus smithii]AKP47553.1 Pantoate--beta-alanine ligase [Bacillus smithii]EHL74293.1 pantoate-beta-alanine ligase [Bacillus smithii 7_3_47FAA]MED0659754.1 pantoate--beta-alanine ligase [Bacillus smithii]MED1490333.1 pantoate--beta-alanine ligase [Bacillus smithii]MED4882574.1 pantoate--beta-alanine ligase [Bacillus smithii]